MFVVELAINLVGEFWFLTWAGTLLNGLGLTVAIVFGVSLESLLQLKAAQNRDCLESDFDCFSTHLFPLTLAIVRIEVVEHIAACVKLFDPTCTQ